MASQVVSDDGSRDLVHNDAYRGYLITRGGQSGDYRSGRTQGKRVRTQVRAAFHRVNGYMKTMIEAVADSKMRRMERELELRGIHLDPSNNQWVTPDFRRPSLRKD